MAAPFSILLADDHVMVRREIRRISQGISDVEVVKEANDGFEWIELLKETSPPTGYPGHLHAQFVGPGGDPGDQDHQSGS